MNNKKTIAVIGSGFSGLSSAAYLAKAGHEVHVYEKNIQLGGRARQFIKDGFTFDMGPSWYWMPEVMESFFNDFDRKASDFFELQELSPAYEIVFDKEDRLTVPKDYSALRILFEQIEPGSSFQLDRFMEEAKIKYDISFTNLIEKPGLSILEYLEMETIKNALKVNLFGSFQKLVHKRFKHPKLRSLIEFPVLFLGAKPKNTPALYSIMSYAGLKLGTYYPMGGFNALVQAMIKVCKEQGVQFHTNTPVTALNVIDEKIISINLDGVSIRVDGVIGSADYHHIESKLMDESFRNYKKDYWSKRTFAPSSLIFYLGVNKKIQNLQHHTLFFDADFDKHAIEIYDDKRWPSKPLFYVCTPSKTDSTVAPEGCENLFVLMPLATGLKDTPELREKYFRLIMNRFEKQLGQSIENHIVVKESYCINDFVEDYNAYGGNAYGLANTLKQTAILKPKIINRKIKNLVYSGQLTVPGPGVPPALISGKISANILNQSLKRKNYEIAI